jgi:hypothetical protein
MPSFSSVPVTSATTSSVPHLRAVRSDAPSAPPAVATPPVTPAIPVTAGFPPLLPEGAAVLAALPQSALPPQLLERYGDAVGHSPGTTVVGYLVLLPAGGAPPGEPSLRTAAHGPTPSAEGPSAGTPTAAGIVVDADRHTVHVDGVLLRLTYLEFELLAHLTAHPYRVHSRDHLLSAVWGYGHVGDGRTVDVHVARLRRKLGPRHRAGIVTVRRVGYKYTPVPDN